MNEIQLHATDKLKMLKSATVLYIDDDEALRDAIAQILSFFFDNVLTAADGLEGLEVFYGSETHIIITDLKMPTMDGLTFIKEIRSKNKNIPIIMASAYAEQENLLAAVKLNLVEYIIKPLTYDSLERALLECVDKMIQNGTLSIEIADGIRYDTLVNTLHKDGESVVLTRKEALLLRLLLENRGTLVEKELIEESVYADSPMSATALRNLALRLRKKLGNDVFITVGNFGYILK